MEHQLKRILLETERYRVTGFLRLPPDGYRSRLSDYLNSAERSFLSLTDVEVASLDRTDAVERHKFLALALSHIVFAVPLDDGE